LIPHSYFVRLLIYLFLFVCVRTHAHVHVQSTAIGGPCPSTEYEGLHMPMELQYMLIFFACEM